MSCHFLVFQGRGPPLLMAVRGPTCLNPAVPTKLRDCHSNRFAIRHSYQPHTEESATASDQSRRPRVRLIAGKDGPEYLSKRRRPPRSLPLSARRSRFVTFRRILFSAPDETCTVKSCFETAVALLLLVEIKLGIRMHWMQRITFAAETNAADTHTA